MKKEEILEIIDEIRDKLEDILETSGDYAEKSLAEEILYDLQEIFV